MSEQPRIPGNESALKGQETQKKPFLERINVVNSAPYQRIRNRITSSLDRLNKKVEAEDKRISEKLREELKDLGLGQPPEEK